MLRSSALSFLALLVFFFPGTFASTVADDLSQYVSADGVIYADEKVLNLAFGGNRDFTIAMLLTSESGIVDCGFCKIIGPNFKTVASSYQAQTLPENRDLFFILADVENTKDTFKALGVTHVPNLVFYHPTHSKADAKQGIKGPHVFASFTSTSDDPDALGVVFSKQGFDIKIRKPFPWYRFLKFVITILSAGVGGFFFRNQLLRVWQSKQIWLALSIMAVVMFISGHMFNVTRGTSFMGFDGVSLTLIEPNFNSQLAVETQIVATIYATLAFTTIGLIKFVPKLTTTKAQTVGAVFGALTIFFVYSILLETFKMKSGSFPISLLPIRLF